jgi:cytochrome c-type biogenesis protein
VIEGNFAYSFILGVLAAVNPCGFVLLPTYLTYYLGTELSDAQSRPSTSLSRALTVGASMSAGFVGLFLVVGVISRAFTTVIRDNAKYAALAIGVALVAMGVAMLRGWKPPISQPDVSIARKRTVLNMVMFGVVYAIASIGCTIGLLISVILGSIERDGFASGVISIALYGLGMGMLVTTLTVALAFARVGLVTSLKRGLPWFDTVTAVFVILTGCYLTWYWYGAITNRGSDAVISRIEHWQTSVATFLQDAGAPALAIIFCTVIGAAVIFGRRTSKTES